MSYMDQALTLARQSLGEVHPNPPVGAVLVRNGKVISEGITQLPGGPHAEIMALAELDYQASGSGMYSSLEPCCHYGRTPPCTDAIIRAGVTEVHIAVLDKNPKVFSRGKEQLEKAGIKVVVSEFSPVVEQLYEAYFKFITTGLPFVTFKFASSLDGKIAASDGSSSWITGQDARDKVHLLRSESDAVMVGIGTVLADNPKLTARDSDGRLLDKQPIRIIVDSHCRISPHANALTDDGMTLITCLEEQNVNKDRLKARGIKVIETPSFNGTVDLSSMLSQLGSMGITSVLFEGGGTLASSLIQHSLIDKMIGFIAPRFIGGKDAPTPFDGAGFSSLAASQQVRDVSVQQIGPDIMIKGYLH